MEQTNKQTSETNKSPKLDPEEIAILDKFEEDTKKQARDLESRLSDMSVDKLASVFFKNFVYFMTEGRAAILSEAKEDIPLYDYLLVKTLKRALKTIREESDIIYRAFVRVEELEKTLQLDQIDTDSILKEEKEKYYAEKKDNDPEAD